MDQAPLLANPLSLLILFATIVWTMTCISTHSTLKKFFKYLPVPLWCYFIPTILSTFNIIPSSSELYSWMSRLVLPACLILLLIGTDLRSILRLSPRALAAMLVGSLGIFIGGFLTLFMVPPDNPDFWKGWASLSASWTGGSANMIFVKEILETPEDLFSNLLIVDTIIAYSWMALLVYFSRYKNSIDHWLGARSVQETENKVEEKSPQVLSKKIPNIAGLIALSLGLAALLWFASGEMPVYKPVFSRFTWLMIFSTTLPLVLSMSPASKLESWGASATGKFMLYLLLTSIGAKASLSALTEAPFLILIGFVWVLIHGAFLLLYGKLTKTPISILATASQANLGGSVSAPIVASVYDQKIAPMALLMAVMGGIYGTYAAVAFSEVCRRLTALL